jgi:hypothetical protein
MSAGNPRGNIHKTARAIVMEVPYATLTPEEFSETANLLLVDAQALAGEELPRLLEEAKAQGLSWVEALEYAIVTLCVLPRTML